ncbi:MAG TPA: FKBP-type peptidyl-prolyl cis-trans isomerase, partial [Polyangiaceae bacterium]|nr:FKBP-type peptidyl-prolyl cis-trans isomerase [Polyangiaceae bacterium]
TPSDFARPAGSARKESCGSVSRLLQSGSGEGKARDDDRVVLDYAAFTSEGQPLDSSAAHGEPLTQSVRNLPPGLVCVVKRMQVGESRRVWVPARLMHTGKGEASDEVKTDRTIDITLRGLTRAPARPEDYAAPPRAAQRTPSGLRFRILQRGKAEERPTPNSRVTVYHSGWTSRGELFESSTLAGHPASYIVYELPQGLAEGLQLMHVGDKARFWLPERLAYARTNRGAPKGPVVFDVELLSIE